MHKVVLQVFSSHEICCCNRWWKLSETEYQNVPPHEFSYQTHVALVPSVTPEDTIVAVEPKQIDDWEEVSESVELKEHLLYHCHSRSIAASKGLVSITV